MKNGKLKKLITLATVVASTFALVACGSSSSDDSKGSDSSAKKDSETVYRTLDEIKKDGTINIGVSPRADLRLQNELLKEPRLSALTEKMYISTVLLLQFPQNRRLAVRLLRPCTE